jgi:octaprenyl-diphosphate synthase
MRVGKPTGIDIKEQKMTLPLIHVLNTSALLRKVMVDQFGQITTKTKGVLKEVVLL